MGNDSRKDPGASTPEQAAPPAEGRQDHHAMRVDAMTPVTGPASTDTLAAGGGLDVPGSEPQSTDALTTELSVENAIPELIPGAYERDTATRRQPGAIGGQFNGADNVGVDSSDTMDERTADEHRREGGGNDHVRTTKADDQRARRR